MKLMRVVHVVGWMIFLQAGALLIPTVDAWLSPAIPHRPFLVTLGISVLAGLIALLLTRGDAEIGVKEGILIVVLAWTVLPILGALPFYLSGAVPRFDLAYFEAVSGYTTTGASILTDVESVARPLLLWRSLTHWLGGMGIVVLLVAVLPASGFGGARLYTTEVSDVAERRLTPRIRNTARILLGVYVGLTLLETVSLRLAGMGWFDSICHAFGTVATGGFSTRNRGVASFDSATIEMVIVIFMVLSGLNFALLYRAACGQPRVLLRQEEARWFLFVLLVSTALVALDLRLHAHTSWPPALREGVFQVVSINTTTGFASADFSRWPAFSRLLLILLMFVGACPGSTCGAIKNLRFIVVAKAAYHQIRRMLTPKAVTTVRLNGRPVAGEEVNKIVVFVIVYMVVWLLATLTLTFMQIDIVTALSAVAATMGGVGPGLGTVGPMASFAGLPQAAIGVLTGCMLIGRLEIFAFIVVFLPAFWKR